MPVDTSSPAQVVGTRDGKAVETLGRRWNSAKTIKEAWKKQFRVDDCYQFWRGIHYAKPTDPSGARKIIVNKIHSDMKQQLPSLYFYEPFGEVVVAPEKADVPSDALAVKKQLLQDQGNNLVRDRDTNFMLATELALKDAQWSIGVIEVIFSSDFNEIPTLDRPPLKEQEDTTVPPVAKELRGGDDNLNVAESLPSEGGEGEVELSPAEELRQLRKRLKSERFYIRHIPSEQFFFSPSDKPVIDENDWVGYFEDVPLEDVKKASKLGAYKNTRDLKATKGIDNQTGEETDPTSKVRLYKQWDLRTKTRYVWAEGNPDKLLLKKSFKRRPLKILRFDIDPCHAYPIPPIYNRLGPQEEYNQSREFLRKERIARVSRFTAEEDSVDQEEIDKFERGEAGIIIKRKKNTTNVIEPINQPSLSDSALRTLTLSEKEFSEQSGAAGDPRVGSSKTATQAVIANSKEQAEDSDDRRRVAKFLGEIIEELILLSVDYMNIDRWIVTHVEKDSPTALAEAVKVVRTYKLIKGEELEDAAAGIRFQVVVDVETLSPVAKAQRLQKLQGFLGIVGNPMQAAVLAASPLLLTQLMDAMDISIGNDSQAMVQALKAALELQSRANMPGPVVQAGQPVSPTVGPPTELPLPAPLS